MRLLQRIVGDRVWIRISVMKAICLIVAVASFAASTASAADSQGERLQVGIYEDESPLGSMTAEPTVQSVRWAEGDLQVRVTQAAPCGNYIPVNRLCLKHVQAWVFRVPDASYNVPISDAVPRFVSQAAETR